MVDARKRTRKIRPWRQNGCRRARRPQERGRSDQRYPKRLLIGAAIVVAASSLGHHGAAAALAGAVVCFLIRLVGLRFGLVLPTAPSQRDKPDE